MIFNDVFERFFQDSPLSVMAQGIMENAMNPQILDELFEDVAQKQFTNKLLFSTVVDLDEHGGLPHPALDPCRLSGTG